jgi:hypothetical protein
MEKVSAKLQALREQGNFDKSLVSMRLRVVRALVARGVSCVCAWYCCELVCLFVCCHDALAVRMFR